MQSALNPPATGNVTNHAYTIDRKRCQSTFLAPKKNPMETKLPTMQCVLETGIPNLLAIKTVTADEVSTTKPLRRNFLTRTISQLLPTHVVDVIFVMF